MPGGRIDAELAAVVGGALEQLTGLGHGELIGGDVGGHVGPLALVILQVGPVTPHSQSDALADLDGVDGPGVDLAQVLHQGLETLLDVRLYGIGGPDVGAPDRERLRALPEVEAGEPVDPILLSGGDAVEVGLHGSGEVVVDQLGEVLLQQAGDREGEPGGHEGLAAVLHISAVRDRGHGGRIGRGTADLALLQGLDQGGLGVARRRGGLVAGGLGGQGGKIIAGTHRRQAHVLVALGAGLAAGPGRPGRPGGPSGPGGLGLVALGVAPLLVGGEESAERDDGAGGGEAGRREGQARIPRDPAGGLQGDLDSHGGGRADGVGHLRGDGALPDELIEAELSAGELIRDLSRSAEVVPGGANGLVGLLRALGLRGVDARLGGHVLGPVQLGDLRARRCHRLAGQHGGVGSHIGDETVLVQPLRHPHGFARIHTQLARRLLLEGGGGEGGGRTALVGLLLDLRHARTATADGVGHRLGPTLVQMDGAGLDRGRAEPAGIGEVAPRGHAAPVQGRQAGGEGVRAAGIRILGDRRRTCPRQGGELGLYTPVSG